jgi:capsular exopolysaccharide synthesis family protein
MRLRKFWEAGKLKSIMITSALPQDGKSTISLNLACALSEQGKRNVLLIEADLHHPTLIEQLGLKPWPGLAECIERHLSPRSAIRRVEPLGFHLLPAGSASGNPTDLLHPDTLAPITQDLYPNFDWVLVDAPPLAPLTDALALARHVDGSLLVVRAGRTPRTEVEQAVNLLGSKNVIGIVLNGLEGLDRVYSKYYGYYGKNRLHGERSQSLSNEGSSVEINT